MSWPVTASRRLAEHRLEQHERLALVLVERIALAVGAEADDLAQVLERDEMLAPQMIERLQQHHLLDLAEVVRAELGRLARRLLVDLLEDALGDLLVGDAFLGSAHSSIGRSRPNTPLIASVSAAVFHCSA